MQANGAASCDQTVGGGAEDRQQLRLQPRDCRAASQDKSSTTTGVAMLLCAWRAAGAEFMHITSARAAVMPCCHVD